LKGKKTFENNNSVLQALDIWNLQIYLSDQKGNPLYHSSSACYCNTIAPSNVFKSPFVFQFIVCDKAFHLLYNERIVAMRKTKNKESPK
jgi:hypothetical protein